MFTLLTAFCAREMASDAFYALKPRYGGVSISFAELLLSLPAPATERKNTQRMQEAIIEASVEALNCNRFR
jgi:hypothetical protein